MVKENQKWEDEYSMLKSMTGFGRGEARIGDKYFLVELKSVNHRYVDVSIKLPKKFTYLEENIRKNIKTFIQRGRIEAFISYESVGGSDVKVTADMYLAKEYLNALNKLSGELSIQNDVTASLIARFPDIIKIEKRDENEDEIWECLEEALNGALAKLTQMRKEEGDRLKEDLQMRLNRTKDYVAQTKERSPIIIHEYRQRLTERIKEIINEDISFDENRIASEVALFAEKSNITEEIVRLHSHIGQFAKTLNEDDAIGRKLDFLLQEMNREVNTIGSKANDLYTSNIVINIKSEFEKMREQVQNIE